jgi:CO/xanthine dehydrogenase FAD-binding subunit
VTTAPAYQRPRDLGEALALRRDRPDWVVLAGGTDLLVGAGHRPSPPGVIDLFGLAELCGVTRAPDGGVRIGAATTYAALLASPVIERELPALWACAREVGALQIQARGTIGGNLATSSPVGDTLPVWLALDAELELASTAGVRRLPYAAFITGYRATALAAGELIAAVRVPPRAAGLVQAWRKVGTRRAQSISKVMVALAARLEDGRVVEPRIALGAVADRPIRARAAEAAAGGLAPADAAVAARAALIAAITPIDDVRSTAAYRREVAGNVVARLLADLARVA